MNGAGAGVYTLPTAAEIVNEIPGCDVGSSFRLVVKNNATGTGLPGDQFQIRLAVPASSGLSLYQKNAASASGTSFDLDGALNGKTYEFQVIVTSVTGTETADIVQLW